MNANGFKKFEHDRPYGRFSFRQNLPVCIQHHGSGIRPERLLNRYRRVPGAAPDQSLSASGVYTG